jgi:polyisoprenoid-binding protein YceI
MNRWISAAAMMCALSLSATADAADYTISNTDTLLYIKVYKDPETLAAGISHDHAVRAATVTGSVTWDAANPAGCNVAITVPVSSLTPDESWLRKAAGLEGELDDGMREDVKKNMLSVGQLNGNAHANISFQSTACTASSISGNLTIRGVSQPVTMSATFADHDGGVKITGSLGITASQFGFEPYSALFGQLKNRDNMDLKIKIVAK